jgi:hypothetical protein
MNNKTKIVIAMTVAAVATPAVITVAYRVGTMASKMKSAVADRFVDDSFAFNVETPQTTN